MQYPHDLKVDVVQFHIETLLDLLDLHSNSKNLPSNFDGNARIMIENNGCYRNSTARSTSLNQDFIILAIAIVSLILHAGEEIILAKAGKLYARLMPLAPEGGRRGGQPSDLVVGPEFFEPLPEEERRAWEGR